MELTNEIRLKIKELVISKLKHADGSLPPSDVIDHMQKIYEGYYVSGIIVFEGEE